MTPLTLSVVDIACERDERRLFEKLSFTLQSGHLLQVEGPNGCGKTTLLRLLTLLSDDYTGDIQWCGESLSKCRHDYLCQLIYLAHLPGIKKSLSPAENLRWYSSINGEKHLRVSQALEAVGLSGFEDLPCYSLSAGQQRRVALARLYLTHARLWILDEPFTAIDKEGVERLEALIAEHIHGGGMVVMTSHQPLLSKGLGESLQVVDLKDYRPRTSAYSVTGDGAGALDDTVELDGKVIGSAQ